MVVVVARLQMALEEVEGEEVLRPRVMAEEAVRHSMVMAAVEEEAQHC